MSTVGRKNREHYSLCLTRRNCHERSTGAGGQRSLQLRRTGNGFERPVRPSVESVGIPVSVPRQITSPSRGRRRVQRCTRGTMPGGLPTEPARAKTGADRRIVHQRPVGPGT